MTAAFRFLILLFITQISFAQETAGKPSLNEAEKDTIFANQLFKTAKSYRSKLKYDSAFYYFEQAAKIYAKFRHHNKYVHSLCDMAVTAKLQNQLSKAEALITTALDSGRIYLGEEHKLVAFAYKVYGDQYFEKGKYEKALEKYHASFTIRNKVYGEHHFRTAELYVAFGNIYSRLQKYDQSIAMFEKAYKANYTHFGPAHRKTAIAMISLGGQLSDIGKLDQAMTLTKEATLIFEQVLPKNHPMLASAYLDLARLYLFLRAYDHVFLHYEKAINILNKLYTKPHPRKAFAYYFIGRVEKSQKNYQRSLAFLNQAIDIYGITLGENYPELAQIFYHIGEIYNELEDFDSALKAFKKGLSIQTKNKSEAYLVLAKIYRGIGHTYMQTNESNQARNYYQKCISILSENYGEKHRDISESYWGLGNLLFNEQKYQAALETYQKALFAILPGAEFQADLTTPALKNELDNILLLKILLAQMNTLRKWSENLTKKQRIEKLEFALQIYQSSHDFILRKRRNFRGDLAKLGLGKRVFDIYESAILTLESLHNLTNNPGYETLLFQTFERNKANTLEEALHDLDAKAFSGIPDSLLKEEHHLSQQINYLQTQLAKALSKKMDPDTAKIAQFHQLLFENQRKHDDILDRFEAEYPDYFQLKLGYSETSLAQFQKSIDDRTAFVEFFYGKEQLWSILITDKIFHLQKIAYDATFESLLGRFNKSIRKDTEARHFADYSAILYDKLIRPIASKLAGKKRLVIIPDGELHYLPFEALIKSVPENKMDFSQMAYLLHDFEISYHYSANLYLHSLGKEVPKFVDNAGVFAPVFSPGDSTGEINQSGGSLLMQAKEQAETFWEMTFRSGGTHFKELPYSEIEAEGILDALDWEAQKNYSYIRREATEENFKQHVHQYRYVHLATHSFVNEEQPKLSGIAFAQPQATNAAEDGILYAGEIYNLDINADLITLSSCESGVGKLVRGEGLMAMTRGFLYAGTANVLVSLWKVPDRPTSELMIEFYKQIADEKPYAVGLRAAKLKLIQNARTAFPASWSSFVLIGR